MATQCSVRFGTPCPDSQLSDIAQRTRQKSRRPEAFWTERSGARRVRAAGGQLESILAHPPVAFSAPAGFVNHPAVDAQTDEPTPPGARSSPLFFGFAALRSRSALVRRSALGCPVVKPHPPALPGFARPPGILRLAVPLRPAVWFFCSSPAGFIRFAALRPRSAHLRALRAGAVP